MPWRRNWTLALISTFVEADWAFSGLAAYNSSWLVPPPRPVYVPFDKQVPEETGEDVASWVHARSRGIGGHVVPRVPVVREHPRLPSIAIRQHHLVERAHPSSVTTTTTTTTTARRRRRRPLRTQRQPKGSICVLSQRICGPHEAHFSGEEVPRAGEEEYSFWRGWGKTTPQSRRRTNPLPQQIGVN